LLLMIEDASKSPLTYVRCFSGCSLGLLENCTSRVYTRGSSGEISSRTAALRGRLCINSPRGRKNNLHMHVHLQVILARFQRYLYRRGHSAHSENYLCEIVENIKKAKYKLYYALLSASFCQLCIVHSLKFYEGRREPLKIEL